MMTAGKKACARIKKMQVSRLQIRRSQWTTAVICALPILWASPGNASNRMQAHVFQAASSADQALIEANQNYDIAAAKKAIAQGANVNMNIQSEDGAEPLLLSSLYDTRTDSIKCNAEMTQLLIRSGANVNAVDNSGKSALHDLAEMQEIEGVIETANALIAHGANLHSMDKKGRTPIMEAAFQENAWYFLYLAKKGFSKDQADKAGRTALSLACWEAADDNQGSPDKKIALYLISHGADVNLADHTGRTPLMWLARVDPEFEDEAIAIASSLIKHGAHIDAKNAQGKSAIQIASANHLRKLARYLKSGGR